MRYSSSMMAIERKPHMQRVLFICHGNICRSTMAESVFTELVRRAGRWASLPSIPQRPQPRGDRQPAASRYRCQAARGWDSVVAHRARQVRRAEYGDWDHIVYMDDENARGLYRIFGKDPDGKITRLLDWTDRPGDVADPLVHRQFRCHLPRRARRLHRHARATVGKRGRGPRLRRETSIDSLP